MKKVVFVLEHMLAGGVERSLLSLLEFFPRDMYEVTVLMVMQEGEFILELPKDITIGEIPIPKDLAYEINHGGNTAAAIKKSLKSFKFNKARKIFLKKMLCKDPLAKYGVDFAKLPMVEGKYDLAVCYHIHCPFLVRYVAQKINSKYKVAWVHNDFTTTHYDIRPFEMEFRKYKYIYCVSHKLEEEFKEQLPQYSYKVKFFKNIVSSEKILQKAEEFFPKEYKEVECPIFVTVGRLNYQKGIDFAIAISKKLIDKGLDHRWFVIGEGESKEKLQEQIKVNGLEDKFYLMGVKMNPYPYIRNCTIYIQPSRHEGYGIAVEEARYLSVPIICTDFAGAREQIITGENGIISSFDEEKMMEEIIRLVDDVKLQEKFKKNLMLEMEEKLQNEGLESLIELVNK